MTKHSKLVMTTLAISALALAGETLAMDSSPAANAADQTSSQTAQLQSAPRLHTATAVKTAASKRTIRIVREPLPSRRKTTRADTQPRFVIATGHANNAMKIYETADKTRAMPNLFKP